MNGKLVSVILPIYNIEKDYLRQCVDSILKQTYKNIEIILVDDGSTNNVYEICLEYQNKDSRVKAIKQENAGVSVARNTGLRNSNGEYICFIDPDDWLADNYIEKLYESIELTKSDIAVCNCFFVDDNQYKENNFLLGDNRVLAGNEKNELLYQLVGKKIASYTAPHILVGVPWAKIYRKSMLDKHNLEFIPKLRRMQDNVFNQYAFEYAEKISYITDNLYYYRKDMNSASNKYSENTIENFENYFDESFKYLNQFKKEKLLYTALYMKELTSFNSYFSRYFFNKEHGKTYVEVKSEINQLLNSDRYIEAMKNVDYKYLYLQEKIFVYLLIHRKYRLLKILVALKA